MSQLLQAAIRSGAVSADGTTAPDSFSQGIPFAAGAIAIDGTSAIASYSQGLPMTAAGRIATTTDAPASWVSGSMPINAAGRLCMLSGAVDSYVTGIPFTATGQVAVASSASRFQFNGVDQWVTFLPWTPTTSDYSIEATIIPNGTYGGGTFVNLVSDTINEAYVSVNSGSSFNYAARLTQEGGAALPLDSLQQAAVGVEEHVLLESTNPGMVLTVTPGPAPVTRPQTALPAVISRIAGRSVATAIGGTIWDVKLTDPADPSNSRWYKINDGAGDQIRCYEENGDLKPDNTLDGTIAGFVDNSAWS